MNQSKNKKTLSKIPKKKYQKEKNALILIFVF